MSAIDTNKGHRLRSCFGWLYTLWSKENPQASINHAECPQESSVASLERPQPIQTRLRRQPSVTLYKSTTPLTTVEAASETPPRASSPLLTAYRGVTFPKDTDRVVRFPVRLSRASSSLPSSESIDRASIEAQRGSVGTFSEPSSESIDPASLEVQRGSVETFFKPSSKSIDRASLKVQRGSVETFFKPAGHSRWIMLPPELRLLVLERFVEAVLSEKDATRVGGYLGVYGTAKRFVCALALMSRTLFTVCAPALYSSLHIPSPEADRFCHFLRSEAVHIPRFARKISFSGAQSWGAFTQVAVLLRTSLPRVSSITMARISSDRISLHDHLELSSATPTSRICCLTLQNYNFSSGSALLHVLSAFPALAEITLRHVQCRTRFPVPPAPVTPQFCPKQLRHALMKNSNAHDFCSRLLFARVRPPADRSGQSEEPHFPGLNDVEAQVIIDIWSCLRPSPIQGLHFDTLACNPDTRTCLRRFLIRLPPEL